jgi:cytochrome c oxidase subunit 3
MGLFHHLTRKPWLPEQSEIDNQVQGGAVALPTAKVGLRVFLFPISALFVLFFIAYLMRMSFADWQTLHDPRLLWVNTGVLILSSLALQRSRIRARNGNSAGMRRNLLYGGLFAFAFLAGQLVAWEQLVSAGYFADTNPANAFFYLFTALHGVHLLGGLVAWGRTVLKIRRGVEMKEVRLSVELCTVYWHYLLVVWAAMFSLLLAT